MPHYCTEVPERSNSWIRELANAIRRASNRTDPYFPIVWFMDVCLTDLLGDDYSFEVVPQDALPNEAGRTYPDQGLVQIREDVYNKAVSGDGFGRFTIAHELGHLMMHDGIRYARQVKSRDVPSYCNSEVQANQFAAELLMPIEHVRRCKDIAELCKLCGVSWTAARARFQTLKWEDWKGPL